MRRMRLAVLFLVAGSVLTGCSKNNEKQSDQPECSDGKDNDGDGMVDFPDDPGCTSATDDSEDSPPAPQCSDGKDNDGDGKIDYPNDPGCTAPNQEDESDNCPDGPGCPECSDGKDNDGNGLMDYPNDPGCSSAGDIVESTDNPAACGQGTMIKPLPMSGTDTGTLDGTSTSLTPSPCQEDNGTPTIAYQVRVEMPATLVATTDRPGTSADTVIDVRSAQCAMASAEVACNDDVVVGNSSSTVTAAVTPGTYYVLVKLRSAASSTTDYELQVNLYKAEGDPCTDNSECAPPDTCRIPHGGTAMVCSKPMCNDGVDDDGDGKADYPDDPGCDSPNDQDETDDCPSGPNCPACANGVDDDHDGKTDYPMDTSCTAASGGSESCSTETDAIPSITAGTTASTFAGAHDDEMATCSFETGGPDRMFTLKVPAMENLTLSTAASNGDYTSVELLDQTCGLPGLVCDEGSTSSTTTGRLPAGTYIVLADYDDFSPTTAGAFTLKVSGTLEPGSKCDAASTLGGALTCPTGQPCMLVGGNMVCKPTQCSDGINNDADSKIDYPNDPGCDSPEDDSELDDCPNGPNCPQCSNNVDDDMDGMKDYPQDTSCPSAAGMSESCIESTPIIKVTQPLTPGDLTNSGNDQQYEPACTTLTGEMSGNDQIFEFTIPATTALTVGSVDDGTGNDPDTVVTLLGSSCGLPHIACGDSSNQAVVTTPLAAGTYYAVVDAWYNSTSSNIPFKFSISGTLAVGAACDAASTLNGALTCGTGHTCNGTTHKCQ